MTERDQPEPETLAAEPLDQTDPVTLGELCERCQVSAEAVREMVLVGLVEPLETDDFRWRFAPTSMLRVWRALRLQRDLELNLAGAALAVELVEELHELRRRLRSLESLESLE